MNAVFWQDRLCIILPDGVWMMSRVGVYSDFDFTAPGEDGAVAGNFNALITGSGELDKKGSTTVRLCPVDDDRLLFVQATGDVFVMVGNPKSRHGFASLLDLPSAPKGV
jgi:hypothetical protein